MEKCKCCGQPLPPEELPESIRLSDIKQQIWQAVVAWPGSTAEDIKNWVYGYKPDCDAPESPNIIAAHVVQMNKQLRPHGIEISGTRWEGYRVREVQQ